MRIGIIGHRSWVAKAIARKMDEAKYEVVSLTKDPLEQDMSGFDVVYLIAGRGRPNEIQRSEEVALVQSVMSVDHPPQRLVYISSLAVERRGEGDLEPYAVMKLACERLVLDKPWGFVLRPPVIFGSEQSVWADMLLPSIARAEFGLEPLVIKQPTRPFHLMHVDDVAHAAWLMAISPGDMTRLVSLYSNTIRPIDLVHIAAPDLGFTVPDGWRNDWAEPFPAKTEPYATFFRWHYSPSKIHEAVDGMVEQLIRQYQESRLA